jgi:hypothetical protein
LVARLVRRGRIRFHRLDNLVSGFLLPVSLTTLQFLLKVIDLVIVSLLLTLSTSEEQAFVVVDVLVVAGVDRREREAIIVRRVE